MVIWTGENYRIIVGSTKGKRVYIVHKGVRPTPKTWANWGDVTIWTYLATTNSLNKARKLVTTMEELER